MLSRAARTLRAGGRRGFASAKNPFQQSQLGNGLRVATERVEGPPTATVGVWVDTGSRYENDKNNGVAHFLEHLFFKGTGRRSREQLEKEIEEIGGHLNAYTSREQTVFYAKVLKENVPQAMDILADIVQNSKLDPAAIERERDVILREMQEVDGQMEEVLFDRLHQTAYRTSPLGKTILGPVENIKTLTQQQIKDYLASHYTAPRMVVAAAGDIDHAAVTAQAEKLFGQVPKTPSNGIEPVLVPARFVGSDLRLREDSMSDVHIAYGFETAGWKDSDNFPLMVIQTMLGGYDRNNTTGAVHSPNMLVAEIAKGDLAKSFNTFNTLYSDTGVFGINTVCDPKAVWELWGQVVQSVTGLCYQPSEELVEDAKRRLTMTLLAQAEGSTAVCEDIGRQVLTLGRRMPLNETLYRVSQVDVAAVKAAANRHFYDRDFALAAIGNSWELPDWNHIRRRTYWLRF